MEKPRIVRNTGGGGNEPQGRKGFLSKLPIFKFFTNSNFSVKKEKKCYVGVETPTYKRLFLMHLGQRSVM